MTDSFFGLQMAVDLEPGHVLRLRLSDAVTNLRTCAPLLKQRQGWAQVANALGSAVPYARLGTWDLIRTNAQSEYDQWMHALEEMATWQASDFGQEGTLVLVSVILLVQGGSNADQTLGDSCDIPQPDWLRRQTYHRLISCLPQLNYSSVSTSALYVAPNPKHSGFQTEVLAGDGFSYLKPVQY